MDFWFLFWGLLQAICFISIFQTITFFFIARFDNPGIVDLGWSIGIWLLGLFYFIRFSVDLNVLQNIPALVTVTLLTIWMLRLAVYLFLTRIKLGHKDKRYMAMYEKWGDNALWMMWLSCQFQGLCQFILSFSFLFVFIQIDSTINIFLLSLASVLFLFFLIFEVLADQQLTQFKKTAKKKDFCNTGLWYYSRHPNYFFEIFVWVSITLISFSYPFGFLSLLGPLFLYLIMKFMTAPISERSTLKRCGKAYQNYQNSTPIIFLNLLKKT